VNALKFASLAGMGTVVVASFTRLLPVCLKYPEQRGGGRAGGRDAMVAALGNNSVVNALSTVFTPSTANISEIVSAGILCAVYAPITPTSVATHRSVWPRASGSA
jgi:hypothetical protein